jgi:hypothetical protein
MFFLPRTFFTFLILGNPAKHFLIFFTEIPVISLRLFSRVRFYENKRLECVISDDVFI